MVPCNEDMYKGVKKPARLVDLELQSVQILLEVLWPHYTHVSR